MRPGLTSNFRVRPARMGEISGRRRQRRGRPAGISTRTPSFYSARAENRQYNCFTRIIRAAGPFGGARRAVRPTCLPTRRAYSPTLACSQPPAGDRGMPIDMSPPLTEIGDYEILAKIAEGGMGTVYKGRRRSDGLLVAIKIIPPTAARNPVL